MKILVIEDNRRMAALLRDVLTGAGHGVSTASSAEGVEELIDDLSFDLIILDWTLPGISGLQLVRQWREDGYQVPVLMLTASSTVRCRVEGLDAGADDYLTKPFSVAELLARVRSLLRRREKREFTPFVAGDLVMDPASHQVSVAGQPVQLTPREFAVLEYFLLRKDQLVSRGQLAEQVWQDALDPAGNAVDVTIHRLRRKIDGDRPTRLLHTVRGTGFVLRSSRA
ncbi:MAG: response regulator transcription factor [Acidobacteriota bacterium]